MRAIFVLAVLLSASGLNATTPPKLAFTLFDAVRNEPGVAIAPNALADHLSLLYFGASGTTETEFQSVLFPNLSRDEVKRQAGQRRRVFDGYRSIGGLWMDPRLTLTTGFQQAAGETWAFHLDRAPLQSSPSASVETINAWFKQKTNGRIDRVFTDTDLDNKPDLVGVTVTAFVSPWKQAYFAAYRTEPAPFHFSADSSAPVSMMKSLDDFPYGETEYLKVLRLDYASEDMSVLLLLPKEKFQLNRALTSFTPEAFSSIAKALRSEHVQLSLPKVHYRSQIDWREVLTRLGVKQAFTTDADFSRINENKPEPLKLSKVVQEVWIRWDERGTEALSSTVVSTDPFGAAPDPPSPKSFIADHPFAYVIFHRTTAEVYFMGVVSARPQLQ